MSRTQRTAAFTLVEILIVVVVLGIIAAIVVPQFANATLDARRASLGDTLRTLRNQVQLYRLQHKDQLPDLLTNWDALTAPTTGSDGTTIGSYLHAIPVNSLNNHSNVADGDGTASAGAACGFIYDYAGGAGSGLLFGTETDGTSIYVPN